MAQPTSVLSDGTILELVEAGRIKIEPWDAALVQPASIDLRLGDSFRVFHNYRVSTIDLRDPPGNLTEEVVVGGDEAFVIHPGEFCLGRTLEWVELPDDIVARIEGKALALDTPVPTPDGWTTMGRLAPGAWVFDLSGHPTPVVAASEVLVNRPCRLVEFSDGTRIVADVDHRWAVLDHHGRPRLLTTEAVQRSLTEGRAVSVPAAGADRLGTPQRRKATSSAVHVLRCGCYSAHNAARRPDRPELVDVVVVPAAAGAVAARSRRPRGHPRAHLRRARAITSVSPCESVPVRCIEVGSPDGVFLVGRSFIPTHNSSLGRLGLIVHATAGFCDPGWKGTLTLELNNLTRVPIKLYAGLLIAQLSFMALDQSARRPYGSPELGSHYQGQRAATESRYQGARDGDIG